MRIGFDVDGVILNFGLRFSKFVKEVYKKTVPANPKDWDFGLGKKCIQYVDKFFSSREYASTIPLIDESIPAYLQELSKRYDIELLTEFPERYRNYRYANLAAVGLKDFKIIHTDDKIRFLELNKHRYDVVVDDKPSTIEAVFGMDVFVLCMPILNYNKYLCKHESKTFYCYESFRKLVRFLNKLQ